MRKRFLIVDTNVPLKAACENPEDDIDKKNDNDNDNDEDDNLQETFTEKNKLLIKVNK